MSHLFVIQNLRLVAWLFKTCRSAQPPPSFSSDDLTCAKRQGLPCRSQFPFDEEGRVSFYVTLSLSSPNAIIKLPLCLHCHKYLIEQNITAQTTHQQCSSLHIALLILLDIIHSSQLSAYTQCASPHPSHHHHLPNHYSAEVAQLVAIHTNVKLQCCTHHHHRCHHYRYVLHRSTRERNILSLLLVTQRVVGGDEYPSQPPHHFT